MKAKELVQCFEHMKAERTYWEDHWQECFDYVLPRNATITSKQSPGTKRGVELYDTTGPQAAELLAGALHGMLTNPASFFFELTVADPMLAQDDEVKLFLEESTERMHHVINNSNFQTEVHEFYTDLGVPGTACLAVEEDDETHVRFGARSIGEIYISESSKGTIDKVFRKFEWSARQLVQEYGEDKVGKKVLDAYKKNAEQKFEVLHGVYPRDGKSKRPGPLGYAYGSKTVLLVDAHELSESGFRENPYIVARWTKSPGETYGRSPAMKALADIKMVNSMMRTLIRSAQKEVDPPMMLPDDGFLGPAKTGAGGINYYRSGTTDRIEYLRSGGRVDFGYQVMEDVRKRIRECFYVDQLQLAQGPQMTATEVLQRTEEKLRLMGPMLGRQQSEFLRPLIDRVFSIMLRKKLLPEIPKILSGTQIDVRYSSQVARAQRISDGNNIMRTLQAIAPLAQIDPTVVDLFDADETARFIAGVNGVPHKVMRTKVKVRQIRGEKQKQLAAAQAQAQEAHMADVAAKVGPVALDAEAMLQQQEGVV